MFRTFGKRTWLFRSIGTLSPFPQRPAHDTAASVHWVSGPRLHGKAQAFTTQVILTRALIGQGYAWKSLALSSLAR